MPTLPIECHLEIVKYLKKDHKTLFSYLLASRELCRVTVPILWSEPNLANPKLVQTIILGLSNKSKKIIKEIVPKIKKRLLFRYTQYITIITGGLTVGISKLIQSEEKFIDYYDILYVLVKLIIRSSKDIKILEIDGYERLLNKEFRALLIYAIKHKKALVSLRLLNIFIDVPKEQKLLNALSKNTRLRSLYLLNNRLGKKAGETIAQILLKNKKLTSLNISTNSVELEIQGVEALAHALSENKTLLSLTLSNDSLTSEGGTILANALYNNETLTSLDLGGKYPNASEYTYFNKIRMEGATELANVLRENKALTSLNLSGNRISLGLAPLLDALTTNRNLTSLNLTDALCINHKLTWVNISYNHFGRNGSFFVETLIKNNTLTHLDLSQNFNSKIKEALTEACKNKVDNTMTLLL
ncbi:Protein NLRC3 [Gigaspora margarita]|uniref:Protein NLRC3 n=1 Tax=Gigaspora margarita TaxID=4874 RepID=A0A8H4AQC9_GIGMA|nr:Protein NLRC3 [Gigaspora margarita]